MLSAFFAVFPPCNGNPLLQKISNWKYLKVYVTSYRNKPWYGNRQEIFIALVRHVGLESILSTLSTVYIYIYIYIYIFCMLLKANKTKFSIYWVVFKWRVRRPELVVCDPTTQGHNFKMKQFLFITKWPEKQTFYYSSTDKFYFSCQMPQVFFIFKRFSLATESKQSQTLAMYAGRQRVFNEYFQWLTSQRKYLKVWDRRFYNSWKVPHFALKNGLRIVWPNYFITSLWLQTTS